MSFGEKDGEAERRAAQRERQEAETERRAAQRERDAAQRERNDAQKLQQQFEAEARRIEAQRRRLEDDERAQAEWLDAERADALNDAQREAEAVREAARRDAVTLRDSMRQVDSDFLDWALANGPKLREAYDKYVQKRMAFFGGNPDYYGRMVGENEAITKQRKARFAATQQQRDTARDRQFGD